MLKAAKRFFEREIKAMKKKIALLLIAACLLSTLFSCSSGSHCKHEWAHQELSVYIYSMGDCETPYLYYESCSKCGLRGSEIFEGSAARAHSWFNGEANADTLHTPATCTQPAKYKKECRVCGALSDNETFSVGSALGHKWVEIASPETFVAAPDCTHGASYKCTCMNGCASTPPIFYLGSTVDHTDTHDKDEDGLCVEHGADCDICDDVCDVCGRALKDYEGIDTDNKTDMDKIS